MGVFVLLFSIIIPVLILYATGYRFTGAMALIRTGGIFVSVPESSAKAYIDGFLAEQSGIFQRNIFVQNLKPGSHEIKVVKDGFQPWAKQLEVLPKTVTEAHSFLLPEEPLLVEIPALIGKTTNRSSATSTATISRIKIDSGTQNPEYTRILALFATTTSPNIKRKLIVKNNNGVLNVSWTGSIGSAPYYFCVSEICQEDIRITSSSNVLSFEFYPGRDDLLIINLKDGIYVTEIDNRSKQNVQTLLKGKNLNVIVDGEVIYIKKDKNIYYVSL